MKTSRRLGPFLLLALLLAGATALALWKRDELRAEAALSASQPEPREAIQVARVGERERVRTTTAIGTVRALRWVTLQNELPGTVRVAALVPGGVVEEGALLVALDVAVEEAELAAQEAQARLSDTMLGRMERAREKSGASDADVDRARAERDVARAQVARTRAQIERKQIRAPFRARVGLADVQPGQYIEAGTALTTLQGLDPEAHVDFAVPQDVAVGLRAGQRVDVFPSGATVAVPSTIDALDSRVDPATRNIVVRARLDAAHAPAPGAAVRVEVPLGAPRKVVTVPVNALRKGPAGDHVFVVVTDDQGQTRAHLRPVRGGAILGDDVVVESGLSAGETVAAKGSFKLRDGALVVAVPVSGQGDAR